MKLSKLRNAIREEIKRVTEEEETAYEKFFQAMLDKYGVNSPEDMDDATKKKFFNKIDKKWNAKNESSRRRN